MTSMRQIDVPRRWSIHYPEFESDVLNPALRVSPWSGHRLFAYDMLVFVKPRRVVELGTHYGCSFFTFAQAVKDFDLGSQLLAIDTWRGDQHAGFYDESVFDLVVRTKSDFFGDLNIVLLRKTFDEAASDIDDDSVDLLHIDGYHTYDAVSSDFANWLPKLKSDGLVLFHDVAPECGYGSARFWSEIRDSAPSFEFPHGFGLGVLFPKGDRWYREFSQVGGLEQLAVYEYRSLYELQKIQLHDHQRLIDERDAYIKELEQKHDLLVAESEHMPSLNEEDLDIQRRTKSSMSPTKNVTEIQALTTELPALAGSDAKASLLAENRALSNKLAVCLADLTSARDEFRRRSKQWRGDSERLKQRVEDQNACIVGQTRMIDERDQLLKSQDERIAFLEAELRRPPWSLRAFERTSRAALRSIKRRIRIR